MSKEATFCKIIGDAEGVITQWICKGLNIGTDWIGAHQTIGFVHNGRLIGGLIYHDLRYGQDVWWTLYTIDKKWCNKRILKFMFSLAFDYYQCKRISMMTNTTNVKCQKLASSLGFKPEGILRKYGDNDEDIVVMGILKEEFNL